MTTDPSARDRLFALIASIPGSDTVDWCGPARALLDEIAAVPVAAPPTTEQSDLRDRIRRAVCEAEGFMWNTELLEPDEYGEVADAVLAVLPAPADRAATLREAADAVEDDSWSRRDKWGRYEREEFEAGVRHAADVLRRMAVETEQAGGPSREATEPQPEAQTDTPCSEPNGCDPDGDLCDQHETERAHAEGEHTFCGVTCEAEFPSQMLRNGILAKGYPGTAGMLDELLRRAAAGLLPKCGCLHPADEHSVYGCAEGCGCEWMPKRSTAVSSRPGTEQEA